MDREVAVGTDNAPNERDVGNHHWPRISNYYQAHGAGYPYATHHSHPPLSDTDMYTVHSFPRFNKSAHDATAIYHEPKEIPGCRTRSRI